MGTALKHPMPGRVKPSFVIFDIRALWRVLYSCTHVAPLGVKGFAPACPTDQQPKSELLLHQSRDGIYCAQQHICRARYMLSLVRPSVRPSVTRADQSERLKLECNFHLQPHPS